MASDTVDNNHIPSIFDLQPLDQGGRIARQGFQYQDHIGACFCLDMLEINNLLEVWFEMHDDISLIWQGDTGIEVEFVQVKSEDRSSRWSVASLTQREESKQGTQLLNSLDKRD